MRFSTIFAGLVAASLAQSGAVEKRTGVPLTQAEAETLLSAAGITWSATDNCTDKTISTCTSYDGLLSGTVAYAILLKKACNCTLVITGGTEVGHAAGQYSHANGYKLDFRKNDPLNSFIKTTFPEIGLRDDGYPQWEAPSGNIYCDEGNHWDVVFY